MFKQATDLSNLKTEFKNCKTFRSFQLTAGAVGVKTAPVTVQLKKKKKKSFSDIGKNILSASLLSLIYSETHMTLHMIAFCSAQNVLFPVGTKTVGGFLWSSTMEECFYKCVVCIVHMREDTCAVAQVSGQRGTNENPACVYRDSLFMFLFYAAVAAHHLHRRWSTELV